MALSSETKKTGKRKRKDLSGSGRASAQKPLAPQERLQRRWWLVLIAVWAISGLYVANGMLRGWVPHDEGTLGQSAERVLAGELPHRDFDDPYTGGLSYLHALAFRLLGINLVSLRWVLLLFFLAWVPAVYYVASCLVSPLTAAGAVLLAVVWSVPNYFASLPSWYNLFLAVFGAAFLFRHLETGARKWLFAAGVCAGLSCLIKIAGLYYVAAVLLFLFFREQSTSSSDASPKKEWGYTLFLALSLLTLLALLVGLVQSRPKRWTSSISFCPGPPWPCCCSSASGVKPIQAIGSVSVCWSGCLDRSRLESLRPSGSSCFLTSFRAGCPTWSTMSSWRRPNDSPSGVWRLPAC